MNVTRFFDHAQQTLEAVRTVAKDPLVASGKYTVGGLATVATVFGVGFVFLRIEIQTGYDKLENQIGLIRNDLATDREIAGDDRKIAADDRKIASENFRSMNMTLADISAKLKNKP